jgi:hypothetical protein
MKMEKEIRTEQILLSLKKLDYLSRSQIQRLHNLGGKRNANKVLQELSPFLHHFREGENVYYLSREGREYTGTTKIRKKTPLVKHFLMRNDAYIFFQRPATWQTEIKVKNNADGTYVIPDAIFQRQGKHHFLEIDHIQKMIVNRSKVEKYRKMIEKIKFCLVWITSTEYRKKQLSELCKGLEVQIYTMEEMK